DGSGVTETSRVRVTRGTSTRGEATRGEAARGTSGVTRGVSRAGVRRGGGVGVTKGGLSGVTTGSCGKKGTRGRSQGKGSISNEDWTWSSTRSSNYGQATLTFSGNLPGPTEAAMAAKSCTDCFVLYFDGFIDELLTQIHQWFRTVMCRNRFQQIPRYVHIADNSKAPSRSDEHYDKLWKVRAFLDNISERSQHLYNQHPHISIDERMIDAKCRLSFIQYMPQKPTKWGLKVWVLAGTTTGTVQINRKYFPYILKPLPREATQPRGTTTFAYYDNVTVVRWPDSKDVYAISTADSEELTTVKCQVDSSKKDMSCPVVISNYNTSMGGVDMADQ
uniref:PiggyBac transposable element-derived protein domain-containing protein n=1 Tax=Amphimedon queenslandica TaxID=400682 RepID=A0A1X7TD35_AMPQE